MPENCCHPLGAHKRLRLPDTYVSALMLDRALDAIERRIKTIDRDHDIPYLAGYSLDGKTIFIDRHLPRTFLYKGRKIAVDRYLLLHEEVEKSLIDQLGLHYQHAHQIATRAEEAAVRAEGVSWRAYDRFMQQYVKEMGDERLTKLPGNLDLKPYRDEHDYDLMRRMQPRETPPTPLPPTLRWRGGWAKRWRRTQPKRRRRASRQWPRRSSAVKPPQPRAGRNS